MCNATKINFFYQQGRLKTLVRSCDDWVLHDSAPKCFKSRTLMNLCLRHMMTCKFYVQLLRCVREYFRFKKTWIDIKVN